MQKRHQCQIETAKRNKPFFKTLWDESIVWLEIVERRCSTIFSCDYHIAFKVTNVKCCNCMNYKSLRNRNSDE